MQSLVSVRYFKSLAQFLHLMTFPYKSSFSFLSTVADLKATEEFFKVTNVAQV